MNKTTLIAAVGGALAAVAVAVAAPGVAQADPGNIANGPSVGPPSPAEIQRQLAQYRNLRDAIRTGQVNSTAPLVGQAGPQSIPVFDLELPDVVPPPASISGEGR